MISLNAKQLHFLVLVQLQDDWHPDCFIDVVRNQNQSTLSDAEFAAAIEELTKLSSENIQYLQQALSLLGTVGWIGG